MELPIYIITKYGIKMKSTLLIDHRNNHSESMIYWRVKPKLGCEFLFLNEISKPVLINNDQQFTLSFIDFKLTFEICDDVDAVLANKLYTVVSDGLKKSHDLTNWEREHNKFISNYQQFQSLRTAEYDSAVKHEYLTELCTFLKFKEAHIIVEKIRNYYKSRVILSAFKHWVTLVRDENSEKMVQDRTRWRLHAAANQEIDLQAWYHSLFYQEVLLLLIIFYLLLLFSFYSIIF
jgi:hypothetical protein